MKPGKPTTFASVKTASGATKLVFALPGNPVSSFVAFKLLVHPCLLKLRGFADPQCHHPRLTARLSHSVRLDPTRPEYHRATLEWREALGGHGEFIAHGTGVQRSSRLLSVRMASALLCLPTGNGALPAGTVVPALLLETYGGRSLVPPPAQITPHLHGMQSVQATTATTPASATNAAAAPAHDANAGSGCACCRSNAAKVAEASSAEAPPPPLRGGVYLEGSQAVRVGVLTVSDRASAGLYKDRGGPAILEFLGAHVTSQWEAEYRVVPDEQSTLESAMCDMTDRLGCSLVITTGGTGVAPRDVTPEATRRVITRELPGFGEQMRAISLRHVPTAILSRQLAGIRDRALILNLPGSPRSIAQILPEVFEAIANCVALLSGPRIVHNATAAAAAAVRGPASTPAPAAPAAAATEYTVDAANVAWLDRVLGAHPGKSASAVVSTLVLHAKTQDEAFVFEKIRGCNRKKSKQKVQLALTPEVGAYLRDLQVSRSFPDVGKVLRVILDYALEDLAPEAEQQVFVGL